MLHFLPLMGAMSIAISGATVQELGRRYQTNFYKGAYAVHAEGLVRSLLEDFERQEVLQTKFRL